MQFRELSVPDAFEITPKQFSDDRGVFLEWYRFDELEQHVGHRLDLRQGNLSVSQRGVVRGIHFASVPRGQAKCVTATNGAVLDFVVDVRVGSPTFGRWDTVLLDDVDRRVAYLAEGLGHAFVALTDQATVSYLVTDVYRPEREFGINPLDPDLALPFPEAAGELRLSEKDAEAPSLAEAMERGILPDWETTRNWYERLDGEG